MGMFLSLKKKEDPSCENADLSTQLSQSDARRGFFLLAARALLQCVREFSLDLKELDREQFKAGLGGLSEKLVSDEKLSRIEAFFEARKKGITDFAGRQRDHLRDREAEFKDIIEILTQAMVGLDSGNRQYNQTLLEHGQRIEEITLLDDIKRLKQELLKEVQSLRRSVLQKETRDSSRIELLSDQVRTLSSELEDARTESERDGLTGVRNRRSFDRFLSELVEKNTVKEQSFALLIIDIDNFKGINDTYGHLTGDGILTAVANKCRQLIRDENALARYGGEEFAAILLGASLRNGLKKARQVCETIAATRCVLEGLSSNDALAVTVSIGVSACRRADTVAALVERADKALYLAKHSGKNRAVSERDIRS
jgi:diguanylate cyclase